jgi:arylsulfatase A-like enzyme
MGLVSQFDAHVGRLVAHLEATGEIERTIIIVTSDHGDYLGDHWLGEKDLFHEEIVRIPLIVVDPRPAADPTRGRDIDALVESIDLAPAFLEWSGGTPEPHRLEGRSLVPVLAGDVPADWRAAAFCDSDFGLRHARRTLGLAPNEARGFMVRSRQWKYVHFERYPPQLFDLEADPSELEDLGRSPAPEHAARREELRELLLQWALARRTRVTVSDQAVERLTGSARSRGYRFGEW